MTTTQTSVAHLYDAAADGSASRANRRTSGGLCRTRSSPDPSTAANSEGDETLTLFLFAHSGFTIPGYFLYATGTITDND